MQILAGCEVVLAQAYPSLDAYLGNTGLNGRMCFFQGMTMDMYL